MRFKPQLLAIAVMLSGCSLIPDYEQPEAPVPAQWAQATGSSSNQSTDMEEVQWQSVFREPNLQRLIGMALENNRDLRTAVLNVSAYRAQYRISRADLSPHLGITGQASRARVPGELLDTGKHLTSGEDALQIGLTSYELDLWGRVKSLERSALETYLASEANQRNVRLSLIAEVATSYLTWQTDRRILQLTRATLSSYEENLELVQSQGEVGVASDLDVRQAQTLVSSARAQVHAYTRQVAQDANALKLLLGAEIPVDLMLADMSEQPVMVMPAGLPAELLQRRPDVLAAEHRLLASNADIGAARAAFFPRVTLTASAGVASNQLSSLFSNGSETWNFVPSISIPIFTGGRLKASLDYAKIRKEIAVAEYEHAIQLAFREVSDSLVSAETLTDERASQRELVETTAQYATLAQQRYAQGVESYTTVLDAERQALQAQQKLLSVELGERNAQVLLFKALGGGWSRS